MNNVRNQNGKVLEEMLACSNPDDVKTTLRGLRNFQNGLPPFCKFLKNFLPFLYHFVTWSREYYKWLNRLRHHIQMGRLPVQAPWVLWQVYWPKLLWGSMSSIFQTKNNAVMSIRWWRFPLVSGSKLALLHPNKWL